jgi:hypothetical protein
MRIKKAGKTIEITLKRTESEERGNISESLNLDFSQIASEKT